MKRYQILTRIKTYLDTELNESERWIGIGKVQEYPPEHFPTTRIVPDEYEEVESRIDRAPPMYRKEMDIQIASMEKIEENVDPEYTADRIMSRIVYAMEDYKKFNPDALVTYYSLVRQGVISEQDWVVAILEYRFQYIEESGKIDIHK